MIPLLLLAIALDLLSLSLALYFFFHYRGGKKNHQASYREGYDDGYRCGRVDEGNWWLAADLEVRMRKHG